MEQNLNRVSSAETKDDSSTIVDGTSDVCQHNTNAMLPAVAWQVSELIGDSWQSDIVAETKQQAFSLAERCYHAHLQSKQ